MAPESPRSPPALSTPPRVVILGLWPYATHEQIQYYVQGYEALYPSAQILLLRHSTNYDGHIASALDAITIMDEKSPLNPTLDVLMHLFGGGGAAQGCRLLRAYKVRTNQTLGVKAVVMDSVPRIVKPSWGTSLRSPPRVLAFVYAVLVALYIWILQSLSLCERRSRQNRRDLNDDFLLPQEAKKCYIFSENDLMFTWTGTPTTADADEIERHDYAIKRKSIDESGKWTGDQERYWLGIEDVWDGR